MNTSKQNIYKHIDIVPLEDETMDVSEEEMSDKDEIVSNDSCYNNDVKEYDIEEVRQVLNQAEVNSSGIH